jgi:hypothetical protein
VKHPEACILPTPSDKLIPVTIAEVKLKLKKLDTTKANSQHDFPAWISKYGSDSISVPLMHILNTMINTGIFPDLWKKADVLPIAKVPSPSVLKDFRPISLLFHLGKVAEEIIIDNMRADLKVSIKNDQYGYQPGLSTTDAVLHLLDDFTADLDAKQCDFIQTVCLDFSKAFDCLQPALLVDKMISLKFNTQIIKLIYSFLVNRMLRVTMNGSCSEFSNVTVGVPQGTKLGPILWLIYINDLEFGSCRGIKYADDTTIYHPVKNCDTSDLQASLSGIEEWSRQNSMILNAAKTSVLNVCLRPGPNSDLASLTLNNSSLSTTNSVRFLGVILDQHLTFADHVQAILKKCNSRLYFMNVLKRSGMDTEGLKLFYISKVRTILAYASPAWFLYLNNSNKARIEKYYYNGLL